jgi:APA family basic amino acid/polyamine antiporter
MKFKLRRELGLFEVTFFGVGIILGAGIYALIGPAAGIAGNSIWMSFLFAAFISIFTGLSYAELCAMYPKEAAEYIYVKKASHSPLFAFLIGWLIIVTGVVSAATVSLAFSGYFKDVLYTLTPSAGQFLFGQASRIMLPAIAIVLIAIVSFVNFCGIKESSNMNLVFTSVEIFGLIFVIIIGFMFGNFDKNFFIGTRGTLDLKSVFAATGLIFFAYIGFENIVALAEETKKPRRILPRALILSVLFTTLVYILISVTAISLADWQDLAKSDAPLALAASKTPYGSQFQFIIAISALFATSSTVLIIVIVTSRMMYGMAAEHSLPKFLAKIHPKRCTPWVAITVAMVVAALLTLPGDLSLVAHITSFSALLTFAVVNLALIWLRYIKPHAPRPFKTPVNIGKFPVLAFLGFFASVFTMMQFDTIILSVGMVSILLGVVVFKYYEEELR